MRIEEMNHGSHRRARLRTRGQFVAGLWLAIGSLAMSSTQDADDPRPGAWAETKGLVEAWVARPDQSTRNRVTAAVKALGAESVPALVDALDDARTAVVAVELLPQLGPEAEGAIPALVDLLASEPTSDEDGNVRQRLLQSVGKATWAAEQLVPVLAELTFDEDERTRNSALWALGRFGDPALEALVEVAEDPSASTRDRRTAYDQLGRIGSAAFAPLRRALDEVKDVEVLEQVARSLGKTGPEAVPTLRALANDTTKPAGIRKAAFMGMAFEEDISFEVLQEGAESDLDSIRETAHSALAPPDERESYYSNLARSNPFDSNVAGYLMWASGIEPSKLRDDAAKEVKRTLRRHLAEQADAQAALNLARVIQDELGATHLQFMRGEAWSRGRLERRDPFESYHSLRKVLERGAEDLAAPPDVRATVLEALAKVSLMLGEWDAVNRWLVAAGQEPLDEAGRELWTAPPCDWADLSGQWGTCDASLRSGTSTVRLRALHDGQPMAGVHVLLRSTPDPSTVRNQGFTTGIAIDTLFAAPFPVEKASSQPFGGSSFGYPAPDRAATRYAVTGNDGIAELPQLPEGFYKLEYLIPTANFDEPGRDWDLWIIDPDGSERSGGRYAIDPDPLFIPKDAVVEVPTMDVRSRFTLNIEPWDAVDPDTFVVSWSGLEAEGVEYQVELTVTGPSRDSSFSGDSMASIESATESVGRATQWNVGRDGVGDLRLVPGNIYVVQVRAVDAGGEHLARWGGVPVYVKWAHRESRAPIVDPYRHDAWDAPPVEVSNWYRGSIGYGDGREETNVERIARYVRDKECDFEWEYAVVLNAWLTWHDGDADEAAAELSKLSEALPKGNVAGETARWLLGQMEAGAAPVRRLMLRASHEE